MHRCRTDTCQNERHAAWERIFSDLCKKTNADGSQKVPETVYFKRFGAFERVFGVERGAGRPAGRADARTDGRTHGRRLGAGAPSTTHTGKKYDVRGKPPLTPIRNTMFLFRDLLENFIWKILYKNRQLVYPYL